MNLKLGKSFPVLKFKPDILEPIRMNLNEVGELAFQKNAAIHSFMDLLNLDYLLSTQIKKTKCLIKSYIQSLLKAELSQVLSIKESLKKNLELVTQMIERLDMENIEKDLTELFQGSDGLYALFRYVWSIDLFQIVMKMKSAFQSKNPSQKDSEMWLISRKSQSYEQEFQRIVQKEGQLVLRQFAKEMYIIPDQWGCRLMKKNSQEFDPSTLLIIKSSQSSQNKLTQLLRKFSSTKCDQFTEYQNLTKALFYFQLEHEFYACVGLLKSVLLNNSSGIFTGDFDTWLLVYEVCLKIYARKPALRGKHGIQIDQIMEHPVEDPEFTFFLQKCNPESVSMSTVNFYFKNCPKNGQNSLRGVVMRKIKWSLESNGFKEYEDILQYLETESRQQERQEIIGVLGKSWIKVLEEGISPQQYYYATKHIPDLIEYLVKNPQCLNDVVCEQLLRKMLFTLDSTPHPPTPLIQLIYLFINTLLIQSYEEQFDFKESANKIFKSLICKLILTLKAKHNLQVHEDAVSIVLEWIHARKKTNDQSESDSDEEQDVKFGSQFDFSEQVANLMLSSGRDCDFKLEQCFKSEPQRQLIAQHLTPMLKTLSNNLFEERREVERFLQSKSLKSYNQQEKSYAKSYLVIKGLKDKLLHQNMMNLAMRMNPVIGFIEISSLALEFLTFTTPMMVDDPLVMGSQLGYTSIEPFDICDIVSGEEPIECMKLIYKKLPDFQQSLLDFQCLEKMPLALIKQLGNPYSCRSQLAHQMVEMNEQLNILMLDRFEEFRKFLFYAELMIKVFSKLNEKSQRGIKEIKIIYASMEKVCFRIWEVLKNRVIASQIHKICKQNQALQNQLARVKGMSTSIEKQTQQYFQLTFNKMVKSVKLPYIDSILSQTHYITKICHDLICHVSKVLNPTGFPSQYQKLFNPLQVLSIEPINAKDQQKNATYQLIAEVATFLGMIQFTTCIEQGKETENKEAQTQWSFLWRKNCHVLTQNLLQKIQKYKYEFLDEKGDSEGAYKNVWVKVFLVHLKAEITKILIPFLIKDPLKNPAENPKTYHNQLQETFSIFSNLCLIVEKISQGQEEHLMTFLQIFENFDTGSTGKNLQAHAKVGQYLYKAIQALLELVFKGIRVRSYHFYKFIRGYLRFTKQSQNCSFFNSVIAFYIQNLMTQIIPEFVLPESIHFFCDQNINSGNRAKLDSCRGEGKDVLINEGNLKKSVSQIRFSRYVRFQQRFELVAEKVCAISMFVNLFCRLNFKTLTEGIQKIWSGDKMRIIYLTYLQKMSRLVSKEEKQVDQKLYDIINVDCFGNLSIILKSPLNNSKSPVTEESWRKIIYSLLTLIQEVQSNNIRFHVKNSLTMPVKKILTEIKSSAKSIQQIDYISETIQNLNIFKNLKSETSKQEEWQNLQCPEILDMVITCYNMKLARDIKSNLHLNNLLYLSRDSELKPRVIQLNMGLLERRMSRKDIRSALQKHEQEGKRELRVRSKWGKSGGSKQTRPNQVTQVNSTWIKMSKKSEQLVKGTVEDFISCYVGTFKENRIQNAMPLFNSLKILSLVAVNNPEIIRYLLEHRSDITGLTAYDVMIQSSFICLPVFVELYTLFLKANFGFCQVSFNNRTIIVPNSLWIERKVGEDLLLILRQVCEDEDQNKLEALLKCLIFLSASDRSQSKPHFRIYKFGSINNKTYAQCQNQWKTLYYKQVIQILKPIIAKLNLCSRSKILSKGFFEVLALYEDTLNHLLKQNDIAWMKLNLDFSLRSGDGMKQQMSSQDELQTLKAMIQLNYKVEYDDEMTPSELRPLHSYDFDSEVVGEDFFSLIPKVGMSNISVSVLQALVEYSTKHCEWEGLDEQEASLLLYPGIENTCSIHGTQVNSGMGQNPLGILQTEVEQFGIQQQGTNLEDSIGISRQTSTRSRFYQQYSDSVVENLQKERTEANNEMESHQDAIIEEDCIIEDEFLITNQLNECMSQTSLQFLSQHSVEQIGEALALNSHTEYNKEHLVSLYEESTINPEARKLLLSAMSKATPIELQKFINNQAVDDETEMLAIRELWGRGVVPSATSICKNSRYYGKIHIPSKNNPHCLSSHLNQAVAYKKMHQLYRSSMDFNPTLAYIPKISKDNIEKIILSHCVHFSNLPEDGKEGRSSLWKVLRKFIFQWQNMLAVMEICLKYLSLNAHGMSGEIFQQVGVSSINCHEFKKIIIDEILCGCVTDKVGLNLLFAASWDHNSLKIVKLQNQSEEPIENHQSVLQMILRESCLIDDLISDQNKTHKTANQEPSNSYISSLWKYLQSCDEYKAHSKIEASLNVSNSYPYYQVQESLRISQNILGKIVDRLFAAKALVRGANGQSSPTEELLMVLVYLDPNCFEYYFKGILGKICPKLKEMVKKQHKILTTFQASWQTQQTAIEMEKEEKYWNLRQSKKSTQQIEEILEYFRNLLVEMSTSLLDKFKKLRFNYHCGQQYREWKLQIELLREKLLASGSVEGLLELDQKQRNLQNWKRDERNQIINSEIIPIVQHSSRQLIGILSEAEEFIRDLLDTFQLKQERDKIVIFNTCAKVYEILLAADILTHEEQITYHSMSKLKTAPTIQSLKNVGRRSTKITDRKSARLSINPDIPTAQSILKRIGSSCTFLGNYLGSEQPVRQLHAKYSDVNKRLKVLWTNRNSVQKPRQKMIECRRTHIVQDSLEQIDEDFVNLMVKIKFEGQMGIDYGGVTQEWVTLFIKQIVNPELGLFALSANKLNFQPNRNSYVIPNHLRYFRKVGMLVGKAMRENWLLEINLTKSFLKHLLGATLYVEDLEDIDPDTARSLKWILENDIGDGEDLALNFTYETEKLGVKFMTELIAGGTNMTVDESNKKSYVKLLANKKMTDEIKEQSKAFMEGLQTAIPYSTLRLFSYKQISLYLSGMPTIDLKEMQATAKYQNLTPESQQVIWFWSIISQWSQEELANLLFFLTGSYRVPYGGFRKHPIGLNKMPSCTDYLPVAHTCFSVLDISGFSSREKMNRLLRKSIKQGKGFSVS